MEKYNCDNDDYEKQQPISKHYNNGKAVTVDASWWRRGFRLGVGQGRVHWVCSLNACCPAHTD